MVVWHRTGLKWSCFSQWAHLCNGSACLNTQQRCAQRAYSEVTTQITGARTSKMLSSPLPSDVFMIWLDHGGNNDSISGFSAWSDWATKITKAPCGLQHLMEEGGVKCSMLFFSVKRLSSHLAVKLSWVRNNGVKQNPSLSWKNPARLWHWSASWREVVRGSIPSLVSVFLPVLPHACS